MKIHPFQPPVRPHPSRVLSHSHTGPEGPAGQSPDEGDHRRALGTVGAAAGAALGRLSAPLVSGGLTAGAFQQMGLPPAVGFGAGLVAGAVLEFKDRQLHGHLPLGRLAGAMVGGTLGSALGSLVDRSGQNLASPILKQETRGFSLQELPERALNTWHTSHPVLDPQLVDSYVEQMQPGDLVLVTNENQVDLQIPQLLLGHPADWVHAALYVGQGNLVDAAIGRGVTHRDLKEMVSNAHHARLLRPHYQEGQADKVIEYGQAQIGKDFDAFFRLDDDQGFGCLELAWRSLKEGAPQIQLPPHQLLGKQYLTPNVFNDSPQFDTIADTGSNFWLNYCSKFC